MSDNAIKNFFGGLKETFNDITALEVNTMIVSEIRGMKFNPEEAYSLLYCIPQYLEEHSEVNDETVRERLRKLHQRLERTYQIYRVNNPKLTDNSGTDISLPENLPTPFDFSEKAPENDNTKENQDNEKVLENLLNERVLENLLNDSTFLRKLRKLHELRALLQNSEASDNNIYDLIYAQTVIQLDGDVMNRFDKKLFTSEHKEMKDFLITVHQEAVTSGEKNWRNLLNTAVELFKNIYDRFKDVAGLKL